MNKFFQKGFLFAALSLFAVSSCELDQLPYGSLPEDQTWTSVSDVEAHYRGLLAYIRSVSGGANDYLADIQTDLFNARTGTTSYNAIHNWTFTGSDFAGDIVYSGNFAMVGQANDILGRIDAFINDPETSEADKTTLSQIKGVAYFARAYAYCNLLVRYCKDYEPETASATLGLPIVETLSEHSRPSRATLKATCDFVREDMARARQFMNNTGTLHEPGTDALQALEARFDLYTHEYDDAIEKALDLINNSGYALGRNLSSLQNLWMFDEGNEIIFEPVQNDEEQVNDYSLVWTNLDITYQNLETVIRGANPFYIPTQGLIDLYENGDYRKRVYFTIPSSTLGQIVNILAPDLGGVLPVSAANGETEDGIQFWKYSGNWELLKENPLETGYITSEAYSSFYHMSKPFRLAEQYLIVAEASLMKDDTDEDQARTYLTELRQRRGASAITSTGEQLVKDMQDEWTREFVGEGYRLTCLKRWHQGFTRMTPQAFTKNILITATGYTNLTVSADDRRFTWEIPQQDLQANPNLEPNWPAN